MAGTAYNFGNNAITGEISFPGLGGNWQGQIYHIGDSWDLNLLDDAGRGDGKWPATIPGSATGTITVRLHVTIQACPNPTTLNGQVGTITKKWFQGKTESIPVRVRQRGTSYRKADADNWEMILTCEINDQPTQTGFTPPTSTDDTFADKVQWSGLQLQDDPKSLDQLIRYRLRVYGTTETTAAELTALQAHFTDTAPLTGLKLRPIAMDRVSSKIIYFNFVWSVRDTLQDIEFLQSVKRTEATYLDPRNVVVKVTASSTPPATGDINPDATNLTLVWQDSHQHTNSGHWVHMSYFDKFNPSEAMIEGFKEITYDPVGFMIADDKRLTINQSATPIIAPTITDAAGTSMVCVRRLIKRIGKVQYGHFFWYAYRSTTDQMVADRKHTTVDISALNSSAVTADVWLISGGAPSTPTLSGFVLRDYTDLELPNTLYRIRVYQWGLRTHADDIQRGGTSARRQYFQPASGTVFISTQVKTHSASDVETLLASEVATLEAVTSRPYFSVEVEIMNSTTYMLRIGRPNDDKHVSRGPGRSSFEEYGTNAAGTNVRVAWASSRKNKNGKFDYILEPYAYSVTRQSYRLRRYIRDDHITDIDHASIEGGRHSDSSTFLGRAQYKMKFDHSETQFSWATEGNNVWYAIDFIFEFCSVGFYEASVIPLRTTLENATALTIGATPLVTDLSPALANPATTTLVDSGNFNTIFLS